MDGSGNCDTVFSCAAGGRATHDIDKWQLHAICIQVYYNLFKQVLHQHIAETKTI